MNSIPTKSGPVACITNPAALVPAKRQGLDQAELKRRAWHMAPGLLPFLLWPISHADPLSPTLRVIMLLVFLVLTGVLFLQWRKVARDGVGHTDRTAAIFGYAGSVIGTLMLFPAHAECGLAVLGVLAFGDGSATLLGKLIGGPCLPWNPAKTWAGLFAFFLVGMPLTTLIYWGETRNLEAIGSPAELWQAAVIASSGVFLAALMESVPSRINDNIRVGVTASVVIVLTHFALFGL